MKRDWIRALFPAAAVLFLAAVFSLWIGCPLRRLFGLSCPRCGVSRALLGALRLDFSEAFRFHPLWPLVLPGLVLWVLRERRQPGGGRAVWISLLVLFSAVYVLRLAGHDPVVWPDLPSGLLIRAFD